MAHFQSAVFGGVGTESMPLLVATQVDEPRGAAAASGAHAARLTAVVRSCPVGAFAVSALTAAGTALPDSGGTAARQVVVAWRPSAAEEVAHGSKSLQPHSVLLDPTLPIGPQLDALTPLRAPWRPASITVSLTPAPAPSDATPPAADVLALPAGDVLPLIVASFHHGVKQSLFACLGPAALTRMVDAGDGSWQEAVWRGARGGDPAAVAAGWERLLRAGDDFKGIPVRFLGAADEPGCATACMWSHQAVLPPATTVAALAGTLAGRGLLRLDDGGAGSLCVGASAIRCSHHDAGGAWACSMLPAASDSTPGAAAGVDVSTLTLLEAHRCLANPDGFLYVSCPPA